MGIAISSGSLADLFTNLRYEGHPALWYLLLRSAAAISSSPVTLAVVQGTIATATLAILIGRAPFPMAEPDTLPPGIGGLAPVREFEPGLGGFGKIVFRIEVQGPRGTGLPACAWTSP